MNLFGIGGAELVLIILIMLIVAGPKRMLQWAYILGKYVAQLQKLWAQAAAVLQKEFDNAGVDLEVPKELPTRGDLQRTITTAIQKNVPVNEVTSEINKDMETVRKATQFSTRPASAPKAQTPKYGAAANGGSAAPTAGESKPQDSGFGTWSGSEQTEDPS